MGGTPLRLKAEAVAAYLQMAGKRGRRARELWQQIREIAAGAVDVWQEVD